MRPSALTVRVQTMKTTPPSPLFTDPSLTNQKGTALITSPTKIDPLKMRQDFLDGATPDPHRMRYDELLGAKTTHG